MASGERFWETVPLAQLSAEQWESLCDGCGKCCLVKLQDDDSDRVYTTRVACRLLNVDSCRCRDYPRRRRLVPECVRLDAQQAGQFDWLPATCAYRRLAAGEALPSWHHLLSGDRGAVHRAGASVRGWAISAEYVHEDEFEQHIIQWVE